MPDDLVNDAALWDEVGAAAGDATASQLDIPAVETPPAAAPVAGRDEQGRFAKVEAPATSVPTVPAKADAPIVGKDGVANPTAQAPQEGAPKPEGTETPAEPVAGVTAPPKGWTPAAKAKWDALDPDVRGAIEKREQEVSEGFKIYSGLAKHADRCAQHGRTLAQEADRYFQAEQNLAQNPVGSLLFLCEHYKVHPDQLLAALQGGPAPQAQGAPQPRAAMPAPQPDVRSTVREVMAQDRDQADVETFFADPANRYAENVRSLMSTLISSGQVASANVPGTPLKAILADAYQMACRADSQVAAALAAGSTPAPAATTTPTVPAAPTKASQAAAARARTGSVTGSPLPAGTSRDPSLNQRAADAALWDDTVG